MSLDNLLAGVGGPLWLVLVALVAGLAILQVRRRQRGDGEAAAGFRARGSILDGDDRARLDVLREAVGARGVILAKVSLAALLVPGGKERGRGWQGQLQRLGLRTVDFVVCHPRHGEPQVVVQIRDGRDDGFLGDACRTAGLSLMMLSADDIPGAAELRERLERYLYDRHDSVEQISPRQAMAVPVIAPDGESTASDASDDGAYIVAGRHRPVDSR